MTTRSKDRERERVCCLVTLNSYTHRHGDDSNHIMKSMNKLPVPQTLYVSKKDREDDEERRMRMMR